MKQFFIVAIVLTCQNLWGQIDAPILTYEQFLQQVYEHHPISKQINIQRDQAKQYLKKARGGFDPKLGTKWDYKNFGKKNYYNILNTYLKVPVWSDISIEAGYNYTQGYYLNPENTLPQDGQAFLGLKIPLLKGLWTSERRTALQQAKLMVGASEVQIQTALNDLLYAAGKKYWEWGKSYNELLIIQQSLTTAEEQFNAVQKAFRQGDKPAIDTLKAFIRIQDRTILLNNKQVEVQNAARLVAAYLWDENQEPLMLKEGTYPITLQQLATQPFDQEVLTASLDQIEQHPDLAWYDFKLENLELERKLKINNLMPKLDVKYNFLSTNHVDFFATSAATPIQNYKLGVQFSMPIFVRKERADLALTQLKLKQVNFQQAAKQRDLKTKIENYFNEVQNASNQTDNMEQMVDNYKILLDAEKIKFDIGESSVFMMNIRENQLLDAQLKLIKQQIMYLKSRTAFFWIIANLQSVEQ
ncbi:TolC family protein [Aureispira anguillae]|uniref:TolC family protein n=1 Tax=Aureispira anguillae TaxID=2864201 RepID=A0A916DW56_9BACT|nr:TolC family protein [Aureispira anguillae]BDS15111.1 TolC family protein [Aureispira anguillae]